MTSNIISRRAKDELVGQGAGIILDDSCRYNVMERNTITGNLIGINMRSLVDPLVHPNDHNTVEGNRIMRNHLDGIHIEKSNNNLLIGNRVMNNGIDAVADNDNGIKVINSDGNTVESNVVRRNHGFDLFWDEVGTNNWIDNKYGTKNW